MLNDPHSPIPQVEEKKKEYTDRAVKRDDCVRKFQNITGKPVKQILHAVYRNILQNLPILRKDFRMSEDIYVPSVPHLQGKKVRHKVQHVYPTIVPNFPKGNLDRQKNATL